MYIIRKAPQRGANLVGLQGLEPWTQSAVRFQILVSEISEVNEVNPENCYELAHNRYVERSKHVDKKKGTPKRVPNLVGLQGLEPWTYRL